MKAARVRYCFVVVLVTLAAAGTLPAAPPVLNDVVVTPSTPYESSMLTCVPSATDPDGDPVTYTYSWIVNGMTIPATSQTLTGTHFKKADAVQCRVTASDGTSASAPMASPTLVIHNTAPSISAASLSPNPATTAMTVTCMPNGAVDADGDPVAFTYAWTINGAASSFSTATLAPPNLVAGQSVKCSVTPNDGTSSGPARSSSAMTITAPPHSLLSARTSSRTLLAGASTNGQVAIDAAAPAGGLAIQLTTSSSALTIPPSLTVPEGQTTASFTIQAADVALSSSAKVTATVASNLSSSTGFTLTITPAGELASVEVSPSPLTLGVRATVTVRLSSPAPATGRQIVLSSSAPGVIVVPTSITVPAGALQASASPRVASPGLATVTATANRITKTVEVTVTN